MSESAKVPVLKVQPDEGEPVRVYDDGEQVPDLAPAVTWPALSEEGGE